MLCAIYGILYTCAHEGWVWRLILLVHPAKCIIDELTVFKDLSGDEASSINSWLPTTFAVTPLKFIKSVGLLHNYVTTIVYTSPVLTARYL